MAAALRPPRGAGEGDAILVGAGLVAAAAFFGARCLVGEGDAEGVGVWAIADETLIITASDVNLTKVGIISHLM